MHDPAAGTSEDRMILATKLILAAGTFGSTYLLLKNRASIPGLSTAIGTRFCGNGDLLGFLFNARESIERTAKARSLVSSRGPVITSAVRVGDRLDGDDSDAKGRGYYVQDAGYPGFLNWLMETEPAAFGDLPQFPCRGAHARVSAVRRGALERLARPRLGDRQGVPVLFVDARARDGPGSSRRHDVPRGGPPPDRLDDRDLDRLLRPHARDDGPHRRGARCGVCRQPAVVGQARHHRASARGCADGTLPARGRRRPVGQGLRLR